MATVSTRSTILGSGVHVEIGFCVGSVQEFYEALKWPPEVNHLAVAVKNGTIVDGDWSDVYIDEADHVMFALLPAGGDSGGKQMLATIASLALLVAAPIAGSYLASVMSGVSKAAATAVVSVVGSLLIGAVFKPPVARMTTNNGSETPFHSITGFSNRANPYGVVPRLYGRMKMYPIIAAEPVSITSGGVNTAFSLYDCGYGPLALENISRSNPRIGETPVRSLQNTGEVQAMHLHEQVHAGATGAGQLKIYKNDFKGEGVNVVLEQTSWPLPPPDIAPVNSIERNTAEETNGVLLDIYFPAGLSRSTKSGSTEAEVGIGIARKNLTLNGPWENVNPTSSELQFGAGSEIEGRVVETSRIENRDITLLLPVLYEYDGSSDPVTGTTINTDPNFQPPWIMQFGCTSHADLLFDNLSGAGMLVPANSNSHAQLDVPGDPGGSNFAQYKIKIVAGHIGVGVAKVSCRYATNVIIRNWDLNPPSVEHVSDFVSYELSFRAVANEDIRILIWPDQRNGSATLAVDMLQVTANDVDGGEVSGGCELGIPGLAFSCGGYTSSDREVYFLVNNASANPINVGDRIKIEDDAQEYNVLASSSVPNDDPLEPLQFIYTVELDGNIGPLYKKGFSGATPTINGAKYTLMDARHRKVLEPGIYIKANKLKPFGISIWLGKSSLGLSWPSAQWAIRLGRISENNPALSRDEMVWQILRSVSDRPPINLTAPHAMIELQVNATNKLSGNVDTLSVIPHSILAEYNSTGRAVSFSQSSNPAWIYVNILIGTATQNKPMRSLIDWLRIIEWASYCAQNGLEFNAVIDWSGPMLDLLELVCSVGRATFALNDGLYSVLFDGDTDNNPVPVQLITPHNSWGASAGIKYIEIPHALKLPFKNEALDYADDVRTVYMDGYNQYNATKIEEIFFTGITSSDQIYKAGRYYLAQAVLQRESISVKMDIENLVLQRGDIVAVANDTFRVGGGSCRVTEVGLNGSYLLVDQYIGGGVGTGFKVRTDAGVISGAISAARHATIENRIETPSFYPEKSAVKKGDLIVWGFVATVTGLFRVSDVYPSDDLSATVEMIEHNPQVYEWDGGAIPPHEPIGGGIPSATIGAVSSLAVAVVSEPDPETHIWKTDLRFSWVAPTFGTAQTYNLYQKVGAEWQVVSSQPETEVILEYGNRPAVLDVVEYGVSAISMRGVESDRVSALVTIPPDGTPPADVSTFAGNALVDGIELEWEFTDSVGDLAGFQIMYSDDPVPGHSDYENLTYPATASLIHWGERSIILPGKRRGAYHIKAVDTSELESVSSLSVYSDAPADDGAMKCINSHTVWANTIPGPQMTFIPVAARYGYSFTKKVSIGSWLLGYASDILFKTHPTSEDHPVSDGLVMELVYDAASDTFYPAGLFESPTPAPNFVRNTACYLRPAVVLEKRVLAGAGYIDISETTTRSLYKTWSNADPEPSEWSLITAERVYIYDNVQFAVELRTHNDKATPVVLKHNVCQSFDTRTLTGHNVAVPASGLTVTFATSFEQTPTVNILAESMLSGDSWQVTQKTNSQFFIQFFSSTNTPKAATIDWTATGYGVGT